jgi:pilus assembly protein CpaB
MKKVKILALVMAIVTAGLLFWYLNTAGDKVDEADTTKVVIAAEDIPENTEITSEMLITADVPVESILAETYDDPSLIIGMAARVDILAGEQIVSSRLVEIGTSTGGTLAYSITPGMRAITIAVSEVTGLKSLIRPGDYVDIISEYIVTGDIPTEKLLLQNILVLATDQALSESGVTEGATEYTTLTLEVTTEQALKLSISENNGIVRAILRSPLDKEDMVTEDVTISNILP